jgi:hypothetical protein
VIQTKDIVTPLQVGQKLLLACTPVKDALYMAKIQAMMDDGNPELAEFSKLDYVVVEVSAVEEISYEIDGEQHTTRYHAAKDLAGQYTFKQTIHSHKTELGGEGRWSLQMTEDKDYIVEDSGSMKPIGQWAELSAIQFALKHWWRDASHIDWGPALNEQWAKHAVATWPEVFGICEEISDDQILEIPDGYSSEDTPHFHITGPKYHHQACVACTVTEHYASRLII